MSCPVAERGQNRNYASDSGQRNELRKEAMTMRARKERESAAVRRGQYEPGAATRKCTGSPQSAARNWRPNRYGAATKAATSPMSPRQHDVRARRRPSTAALHIAHGARGRVPHPRTEIGGAKVGARLNVPGRPDECRSAEGRPEQGCPGHRRAMSAWGQRREGCGHPEHTPKGRPTGSRNR